MVSLQERESVVIYKLRCSVLIHGGTVFAISRSTAVSTGGGRDVRATGRPRFW